MPDINLKLQIDKNDLKKKLDVKDGKTPTPEELTELIKPLIPEPIKGGRGEKGVKGDKGIGRDGKDGYTPIKNTDYFDGQNGRDGIDKEPETPEGIIEKINPLKNKLNFQILKNVPDFVLYKDLPTRGGDQGGGGGSIITFRDSTAARISAYVTDLQFGTGLNTSYSNGKITLTGATQGVTSVGSADGSITVTNPTTTPDLSVVQAPKLTTGRTISITGDIAYTSGSFDGSGNVTAAGTLATVNSNVGTFGSATQSTQITVNGKGLITAIANVTVTPAVGSITGLGTGVATALGVNIGSAGAFITFNGNAGTPSALVGTNISGTAASLTAATVTTNANLTGPITSVGNATSIASQTGTGTKFVVDTSPTIVTPTFTTNFTSPIWKPASNSTTAMQITKADGTTNVLNVDTTNGRVGIGLTNPSYLLDLNGRSRVQNDLVVGGATPSTWGSYAGAMDGGTNAVVFGASGDFHLVSNAVGLGTWTYYSNGTAANMYLFQGELVFRNAPSGSTGGAITWTERFKVGASAITFGIPAILKGYTVATLPAGSQGMTAFCTDLLAPAFNAVVVGGGAVVGVVFFDGTNWKAI